MASAPKSSPVNIGHQEQSRPPKGRIQHRTHPLSTSGTQMALAPKSSPVNIRHLNCLGTQIVALQHPAPKLPRHPNRPLSTSGTKNKAGHQGQREDTKSNRKQHGHNSQAHVNIRHQNCTEMVYSAPNPPPVNIRHQEQRRAPKRHQKGVQGQSRPPMANAGHQWQMPSTMANAGHQWQMQGTNGKCRAPMPKPCTKDKSRSPKAQPSCYFTTKLTSLPGT
jgi:hypothetical protein